MNKKSLLILSCSNKCNQKHFWPLTYSINRENTLCEHFLDQSNVKTKIVLVIFFTKWQNLKQFSANLSIIDCDQITVKSKFCNNNNCNYNDEDGTKFRSLLIGRTKRLFSRTSLIRIVMLTWRTLVQTCAILIDFTIYNLLGDIQSEVKVYTISTSINLIKLFSRKNTEQKNNAVQ